MNLLAEIITKKKLNNLPFKIFENVIKFPKNNFSFIILIRLLMYRYLYKNVHKKRILYATTYSKLKIYLRRKPLKDVKYNVCIQTKVKMHIFITNYISFIHIMLSISNYLL